MATVQPQRMRVKHGRVMHRVEPAGPGMLRSMCRTAGPASRPRAQAPAGDWSPRRDWYPDCRHCPPDPPATPPLPVLAADYRRWAWAARKMSEPRVFVAGRCEVCGTPFVVEIFGLRYLALLTKIPPTTCSAPCKSRRWEARGGWLDTSGHRNTCLMPGCTEPRYRGVPLCPPHWQAAETGCRYKYRHPTEASAAQKKIDMGARGIGLEAYYCPVCRSWHLGQVNDVAAQAIQEAMLTRKVLAATLSATELAALAAQWAPGENRDRATLPKYRRPNARVRRIWSTVLDADTAAQLSAQLFGESPSSEAQARDGHAQ